MKLYSKGINNQNKLYNIKVSLSMIAEPRL